MATPLSKAIGDAVLAYLAGYTYTPVLTAFQRKPFSEEELPNLTSPAVTMTYIGRENEPLNRTHDLAKLTFDIALQKKLPAAWDMDDVDDLVGLMEDQVGELLDERKDFNVTIDGDIFQVICPDGPSMPVVYSVEDLRTANLFTAVMRVQYQVINPAPPTRPAAIFSWELAPEVSDKAVNLDGSASVAFGGRGIATWEWLVDGIVRGSAGSPTFQTEMNGPGSYVVGLRVTDSGGNVSTLAIQTVTVP